MKLHLGCGVDKKEGYINCDNSKEVKPDKIIDLENKLPFKDNSVDEIIINHTLEHIKNFIPLMEEFHRICKKNAIIKIRVPYFASCGAFQDPTHVRFFTLRTFEYFDVDSVLNYYSKARFKIIERKLKFTFTQKNIIINFLINKFQTIYERLFAFTIPSSEMYIELKVMK